MCTQSRIDLELQWTTLHMEKLTVANFVRLSVFLGTGSRFRSRDSTVGLYPKRTELNSHP
jgi:hypothetical protein